MSTFHQNQPAPKQPFAHFKPARWRGTTYPTSIEREGRRQVVALSFDTPQGVLHIVLDEKTADEVGHACAYFRTAQSERSSDIPNSEISPSNGQLQEPPAICSTATSAETGAPLWPAGHLRHGWGDQPAAGFSPIVPAEPRSPGRDILLIGLMLAGTALGLVMGWPK